MQVIKIVLGNPKTASKREKKTDDLTLTIKMTRMQISGTVPVNVQYGDKSSSDV